MKKKYINPELEVVKLNAKYQLMAGSIQSISDETPSEWGSREFDDFDDFDDI